jgi:hypothetical protein
MSALNTFVFMTFPLNVSAAQRRAWMRATPDGRERTKRKPVETESRNAASLTITRNGKEPHE